MLGLNLNHASKRGPRKQTCVERRILDLQHTMPMHYSHVVLFWTLSMKIWCEDVYYFSSVSSKNDKYVSDTTSKVDTIIGNWYKAPSTYFWTVRAIETL